MAEPASFVDELEISQTSAFMKRKCILVQDERVIIYGQEFKTGDPVVLKYSPCGENSKHECLVKRIDQVRLPILSSIALRLHLLPATPALAKRSRKVEHSQILTTSPYKKLLFDATTKANTKQ